MQALQSTSNLRVLSRGPKTLQSQRSPLFSTRPFVKHRTAIRAQNERDEEAEFEQRIADLKKSKGETPYGETRKSTSSTASKPKYDYSDESVYYEGSPHTGDVMVNVILGATLVWLPLTVAAITRKAFVKYRITDKRVSVTTEAPWKNEQLDVAYEEVKDVVAIGRGVGVWGDMVITLKNGDKVEIRSLDKWQEIKNYVLERTQKLKEPKVAEMDSPSGFS